MRTRIFDPRRDKNYIEDCAAIIRAGGLLGIPTETVYGLGANALNEDAVARIFEAKGRPQDNPLIIHVPNDIAWLGRYCREVPPEAYLLAERFWPGPLTMILPRRDIVPLRTTGGLETVGVRCPDHPVTQAIIAAAGVPIAAPSGNTSGRPSPTNAGDMRQDMEGKIDAIVDGGPCTVGVESTIIDLTVSPPRLLRPGGLPLEALEEVLGEITVDRAVTEKLKAGERPRAPGMAYRHYAPKAPVTVITGSPMRSAGYILRHLGGNTGVICFDEFAPLFPGQTVERLGPMEDKSAQARRVFDALRAFDSTSVTEIYAQCPDKEGLGLAIANRLQKAAGFHVVDAGAPLVIGITGPTGAGKTSALEALRMLGAWCWTATPFIMRCSAPMPASAGPSRGPSARCSMKTASTGSGWAAPYSPMPTSWPSSTGSSSSTSPGSSAAGSTVPRRRWWASTPSTWWRAAWTSSAAGPWPSPPPRRCAWRGSWPGTASPRTTPACGWRPRSPMLFTGSTAPMCL